MDSGLLAAFLIALSLCVCCNLPLCSGQDLSKLYALRERLAKTRSLAPHADRNLASKVQLATEALAHYWGKDLPNEILALEKESTGDSRNVLRAAEGREVGEVSPECMSAVATLLNKTDNVLRIPILFDMVDAFGKPPSGMLYEVPYVGLYAMGDYDECLMNEPYAQYCLAQLNISISLLKATLPLNTGMCFPANCSISDMEAAFDNVNQELAAEGVKITIANNDSSACQTEKTLPYNTGTKVMIAVCSVFALLSLVGTVFDFLLRLADVEFFRGPQVYSHKIRWGKVVNSDSPDRFNSSDSLESAPLLRKTADKKTQWPKAFDFVTAFSLFKILPTILSTNQPPSAITCIHGIRVLSMFWVILCHTHYWAAIEGIVTNSIYVVTEVAPRLSFQPIINGYFSVDSFFFLSGVLTAYLTLRQLSRQHKYRYAKVFIMYYVHRVLRLTPTYMFVLFFSWFVTAKLGDGPKWPLIAGTNGTAYQNCEKYWWTNLLYINNIYPWKLQDECISWTWYLANDMQFFVIAPIMLIPLYLFFPIGLAVAVALLVASFAITGALAGHYVYYANQFYPLVNLTATPPTAAPWDYNSLLYIKPWHRIQPYLVGIVLGYLLYRKFCLPFGKVLNWIPYGLLWLLAVFLGMSTVYGLHGTFHGHPFTKAANVIYITFSRYAWANALAIVVFACHNGYGWVINSFLSLKLWIPLSRLCFNAYLLHPLILTAIFGSLRDPVYYTDYTLAVYAVAVVALSFGAAGIVSVFVEFPLANVETTFFKMIGIGERESSRQATVIKKPKKITEEIVDKKT